MYNENMNAKDLNLDEKLILLCGKEHSMSLETLDGKLPSITMSDGPHGLRTFRKDENGKSKAVPATAMPSLTVIANSWNKEAAKTDGGVLGDECIDNGIPMKLSVKHVSSLINTKPCPAVNLLPNLPYLRLWIAVEDMARQECFSRGNTFLT